MKKLARRLRDLGCEEMRASKGSHRIWHNQLTGQVTSIPDWGARDLTLGAVRAVIRELGITAVSSGDPIVHGFSGHPNRLATRLGASAAVVI